MHQVQFWTADCLFYFLVLVFKDQVAQSLHVLYQFMDIAHIVLQVDCQFLKDASFAFQQFGSDHWIASEIGQNIGEVEETFLDIFVITGIVVQ